MLFKNWDKEKAKKILDFLDGSQWAKTFSIGVRLFILVLFILSLVFAAGYWYSLKERPVVPVDFSYYLREGKTVRAKLNGDWLQIDNKGMSVTDDKGVIKKRLKAQDIPVLADKIKPYGLINNLVGYYGVGVSASEIGVEAGGGIEFFKLWDFRTGSLVTNKAVYISLSHPIDRVLIFDLTNTAVVGATGYNYQGERQHSIGLRVRF